MTRISCWLQFQFTVISSHAGQDANVEGHSGPQAAGFRSSHWHRSGFASAAATRAAGRAGPDRPGHGANDSDGGYQPDSDSECQAPIVVAQRTVTCRPGPRVAGISDLLAPGPGFQRSAKYKTFDSNSFLFKTLKSLSRVLQTGSVALHFSSAINVPLDCLAGRSLEQQLHPSFGCAT